MNRFAKAIRRKANQGMRGYPVATVAFYGPDDRRASKVAVGIVMAEDEEPAALERWLSEETDVRSDPEIQRSVFGFLRAHEIKSVALVDRIIGCPHEEGSDYPEGEVCPHCPFWAHRDRWTGEMLH